MATLIHYISKGARFYPPEYQTSGQPKKGDTKYDQVIFRLLLLVLSSLQSRHYLISLIQSPGPLSSVSCQKLAILLVASSVAQSCPTLCDPMNCSTPASLSITNSRSSLRLMSYPTLQPHGLQHARLLSVLQYLPDLAQVLLLAHISSSAASSSSCLQPFPVILRQGQ